MAVYDMNRPFGTDRAGLLSRVWVATFGAYAAWNDARQTRKALNRLTDRELDDLGMTRGDIDWINPAR